MGHTRDVAHSGLKFYFVVVLRSHGSNREKMPGQCIIVNTSWGDKGPAKMSVTREADADHAVHGALYRPWTTEIRESKSSHSATRVYFTM